jgi:hypothetical protein
VIIYRNGGGNYDIGCGPSKIDGFIGIDVRKLPKVDIIHDLNIFPWPIQRESVSLLIASHVIEHVDSVISKILHIDNDLGFLIGKLNFEAYEKYWRHLFPAWQVIVELEKQ